MSADPHRERVKRAADRPGVMRKHQIAAIQKRVIDSEAFAHLPPSAVVVLLLLARNLEIDGNGRVFLSVEDAARHGIDRKTLYRALRVLRAAGFIFQTSRGGNARCSTFALTWLPLCKDTRGLYVDNFAPCAWRDWKRDDNRFFAGGEMSTNRGQKRVETTKSVDKSGSRPGDKKGHIECKSTNIDTDTTPTGHSIGLASRQQVVLQARFPGASVDLALQSAQTEFATSAPTPSELFSFVERHMESQKP